MLVLSTVAEMSDSLSDIDYAGLDTDDRVRVAMAARRGWAGRVAG